MTGTSDSRKALDFLIASRHVLIPQQCHFASAYQLQTSKSTQKVLHYKGI